MPGPPPVTGCGWRFAWTFPDFPRAQAARRFPSRGARRPSIVPRSERKGLSDGEPSEDPSVERKPGCEGVATELHANDGARLGPPRSGAGWSRGSPGHPVGKRRAPRSEPEVQEHEDRESEQLDRSPRTRNGADGKPCADRRHYDQHSQRRRGERYDSRSSDRRYEREDQREGLKEEESASAVDVHDPDDTGGTAPACRNAPARRGGRPRGEEDDDTDRQPQEQGRGRNPAQGP